MAKIDLELLRTFVRVFEAGSITTAAAELRLSQPTVSHAVKRLRSQLGDELFVRAPGGVRGTDMAESLYRDIAPALNALDEAVEQARGFDPMTARRRFRLCLTDLGEAVLLAGILQRVSVEAPGVEIEVVPMDVDRVRSWLLAGQVDLAVATVSLGPELASEELLDDRYLCVMRRDHPLASGPISLEDFRAARHVVVTGAAGHRSPEEAMARLGIDRHVAVQVPRFEAVPFALERTDYVAVVPEVVLRTSHARSGLVGRPLPFLVPQVTVRLWRRRRRTVPPALDWLRSVIVATAQDPEP